MNDKKESKLEALSKFLTLILRHKPDILGIQLDKRGFVNLDILVERIKKVKNFSWVTKRDILSLVESDEKGRFEIKKANKNLLIRARYGHNINLDIEIEYEKVEPGSIKYLFHGTNSKVLPWILKEGLMPMARKYVHLSPTPEDAYMVGSRRRGKVVILKIDVERYLKDGGIIWKATDKVYLAKHIPPQYLSIYKYGVE